MGKLRLISTFPVNCSNQAITQVCAFYSPKSVTMGDLIMRVRKELFRHRDIRLADCFRRACD